MKGEEGGAVLYTSDNPTTNSSSVFYSSLLKQLRQKAGEPQSSSGPAPHLQLLPVKLKKEKSSGKPLPFVCPACKKRFQRHIAMNAHFQNEHISGAGPGGERACKLCGESAASLAAVRLHLVSQHNIDLDNPARCLVVEPDTVASVPHKFSVLEASLRSGGSGSQEVGSESGPQSPSPSSLDCESEQAGVEDLSLRRHNNNNGKSVGRPESPSRPSKRARLTREAPEPSSPSPTFSFQVSGTASSPGPAAARFSCSHCNITYPNQTLYFLHRGFHSESNPWRCNGCGHQASDLYDFNSHLFSGAHG